jgi:hypothetical protein
MAYTPDYKSTPDPVPLSYTQRLLIIIQQMNFLFLYQCEISTKQFKTQQHLVFSMKYYSTSRADIHK